MEPQGAHSMNEKGQHFQSQRVIPERPRQCTPRRKELPKLLLPLFFFFFFCFPSLTLMLPHGATKVLLPSYHTNPWPPTACLLTLAGA